MKKTAYSLIKRQDAYPWGSVRSGLLHRKYEVSSSNNKPDLLVTWTPWANSLAYRAGKKQLAEGRDWVVFENGYITFANGYKYYCAGIGGFNGYGDHKVDEVDPSRFEALNKPIEEWKKSGGYILVVAQFGHVDTRYSMPVGWPDEVIKRIRGISDKKIVYKPKASRVRELSGSYRNVRTAATNESLEDLIRDANIVVVWNSKAAIESLLAGVPVVIDAPVSIAKDMGTRLLDIEDPYYPENRIEFFNKLACSQWNADEIAEGLPFRKLLS